MCPELTPPEYSTRKISVDFTSVRGFPLFTIPHHQNYTTANCIRFAEQAKTLQRRTPARRRFMERFPAFLPTRTDVTFLDRLRHRSTLHDSRQTTLHLQPNLDWVWCPCIYSYSAGTVGYERAATTDVPVDVSLVLPSAQVQGHRSASEQPTCVYPAIRPSAVLDGQKKTRMMRNAKWTAVFSSTSVYWIQSTSHDTYTPLFAVMARHNSFRSALAPATRSISLNALALSALPACWLCHCPPDSLLALAASIPNRVMKCSEPFRQGTPGRCGVSGSM